MAASLRAASNFRHTLRKSSVLAVSQRRWAQVHDVRFLASIPHSEKVYEKYKDKLDRKAREIGVSSVSELKKLYADKATSTSPQERPTSTSAFPPPRSPPTPLPQTPTQSPRSASHAASTFSKPPPIKTLSSYLDVQKISTLPEKEIASLWRLRHASHPNSLCAVMSTAVYRKIEATARKHPQFILPIGREVPAEEQQGATEGAAPATSAEIHFLQWTFPAPQTVSVLFTHLAEYKLRGEYAQPHTTVTHHLELAESHGLVLLQGQVQDGRGMSVDDGRWLLMCMQKFYGMEEKEERRRLLKQFSDGDQGFRVEELVDEAEKIL